MVVSSLSQSIIITQQALKTNLAFKIDGVDNYLIVINIKTANWVDKNGYRRQIYFTQNKGKYYTYPKRFLYAGKEDPLPLFCF